LSGLAYFAFTVTGYGAAFFLGYLFGRDDDRKRERAWSDGFAAGVARGEALWFEGTKRWEME